MSINCVPVLPLNKIGKTCHGLNLLNYNPTRIDYGISVRGQTNDFTKNENTNTKLCSQTGNKQFIDFTHSRSADIIKCLNWMTVRQSQCRKKMYVFYYCSYVNVFMGSLLCHMLAMSEYSNHKRLPIKNRRH